jgi:ABC-type branched-subunit amino acid transport system substrate-binding protein
VRFGGAGTALEEQKPNTTAARGRPGLSRLAKRILVALAAIGPWIFASPAAWAAEAEAADQIYTIAVLLSSPEDGCYYSGVNRAIRYFVRQRVEQINASRELGSNRRLAVEFLDDRQDAQRAIANVRSALDDKYTIGMVGLPGWKRAKEVFDQIGREIGSSNIPFISDISVNDVFAKYPNVFTMRASQEDERLPVMGRLFKDLNIQRPAFIGRKDEESAQLLSDGLKSITGTPPLAADLRVSVKDKVADAAELSAAIDELKAKGADLIVVALGTEGNAQALKAASLAGAKAPIFLFGSVDKALETAKLKTYPSAIYQLAWDGLPDVYNDRLRRTILRSDTADWSFEDRKRRLSTGWITGACKPKEIAPPQNLLEGDNLKAISRGTQYADLVGLLATIAKSANPSLKIGELRRHVSDELKTAYATGHGTYRGHFDNWSFRPSTRTASRTPVVLMRPVGSERTRLAPIQYVRLRNDALKRIQTIYMNVDLIRIFRVDDDAKTFFAEFYLSMNDDESAAIDNIEFSNAFIDPENNTRQLSITPLHEGGPSEAYPAGTKIYKVSGKFMFSPDFSRYPFDTQLFSIDIQPKNGDASFIIQPPPESARKNAGDTDGWTVADRYVGYDESFIPIIDAKSDQRSIVPFYKGNFSWIMNREATDYYLRVVVPLAFILIVAYLSIFIPKENFEAVVTIQVTALLSAVALYLSIPKIGSDVSTVSDRIFLFNYMAASLMIGISIIRVHRVLANRPRLTKFVEMIHIVGIPLLVIAMSIYVLQQATPSGGVG